MEGILISLLMGYYGEKYLINLMEGCAGFPGSPGACWFSEKVCQGLGRTVAGKDGSLTEGRTGCARDSFPLRSSLQFEITTLKKKEHSVMK